MLGPSFSLMHDKPAGIKEVSKLLTIHIELLTMVLLTTECKIAETQTR